MATFASTQTSSDSGDGEVEDSVPARAAQSRHDEADEKLASEPAKQYQTYVPFRGCPRGSPGPPPDGGVVAWLQVLAGHLMTFVSWGFITSFGVFQSYYEAKLAVSSSSISWIGTTQIFLLLFIGTISGRASDAGLVHEAVLLGCILIVLGIFMASLATRYYQVLLAQGICVGIGNGVMFMPGLSVPSSYFQRRKALAVAIITSGAGSGGLVYPAIAQQLLPRIGIGWTLRVMGLVTLLASLAINLLLRMRVPPRKSGPLVDWKEFTHPFYAFFTAGFFFIYWAVYFAFYYIDNYGFSFTRFGQEDSINLLLITNGLGIPGRILPGFIASKWCGPLNAAVPTATVVAAIIYCWIAVGDSRGGLFTFAIVYGFFASAIQALFAMALAALTDDLSRLGTRMGMVFSVVAVASLTGSPVAGAIIQASKGSYLWAQVWAGTSTLIGVMCLAIARLYRTGRILFVKV